MDLAIKLYDNDHLLQAKLGLVQKNQENSLRNFFEQIKRELICGQTEFLEVEDSETKSMTFKISLLDCLHN
jgi:hypothetical protein